MEESQKPQDVAGTTHGKYCILMSRGVGTASSTQGGMNHGKERKKSLETSFKRERKKTSFTQEQVVDALGIPLRSLQAYEEGEYPPPFDRAKALAELYGCSIAAFADTEGGGNT